jgi:hypothetical protein
MMADDIRTLISIAALVASVISLYFTRRFWLQSNRPIVTAFVDECSSGNMATAFNLVLSNTGNRPAVNVRLHADPAMISQLLGDGVSEQMAEEIRHCFSERSTVALLRNGEELTTAFGAYGIEKSSQQLNYGVQIPISVTYQDLDKHSYKAHMPLKVFARHGFGGSTWERPNNSFKPKPLRGSA